MDCSLTVVFMFLRDLYSSHSRAGKECLFRLYRYSDVVPDDCFQLLVYHWLGLRGAGYLLCQYLVATPFDVYYRMQVENLEEVFPI